MLDQSATSVLSSRSGWPVPVVAAAKCARTVAVCWGWVILSTMGVPIPLYAWMLLVVAAPLALIVHRPWRQKQTRWLGVGIYTAIYIVKLLSWQFALKYLGPIRTLIMADYGDRIIKPIISRSSKKRRNGRLQGAALSLISYLLLIYFYESPTEPQATENLSGGIAVLVAVIAEYLRKKYAARSTEKTGGPKRLFAFSLGLSFVALVPLASYSSMTTDFDLTLSTIMLVVVIGVFYILAEYYIDNKKAGHGDSATKPSKATVKLSLVVSFITVCAIEWFVSPVSTFSIPGLLLLGLFAFGVQMRFKGGSLSSSIGGDIAYYDSQLSGQSVYHFLSGMLREIWKNTESRSIFGFLVLNLIFMVVEMLYGYWTNSLGLISDGFHMLFDCIALIIGLGASVISKWKANETLSYGYGRVEILSGYINGIFLIFVAFFVLMESVERFMDPPKIDTEKLMLVSVLGLCVNIVGIFAFSHGHSHAHGGGGHGHSHGHSHSHGSKDKKKDKNHKKKHSHGHNEEHEGFEMEEGHSHSHGHKEKHSHGKEKHSHGQKEHKHKDHSHGHSHAHGEEDCMFDVPPPKTSVWDKCNLFSGVSANLSGIGLHVLADTLGSVGVIISSFLIMYFDLPIADPICSFCISFMILVSSFPLLHQCVVSLAQRCPDSLEQEIPLILQKIRGLPEVSAIREFHIWEHSSTMTVATLQVMVQPNADEQHVRRLILPLFHDHIQHLTVQVMKDKYFELERDLQKQGSGSSYGFMSPLSSAPSSYTQHSASTGDNSNAPGGHTFSL